jgi:hypothetical protein
MPQESQSKVTIAGGEFRLEDPELHLPNRLKFEIPDRPQGAIGIC